MPNTFNSTTLSTTYRDDWVDSDGYHKILFNSGRSLQARELTQMQTIIQEEISRFGRNIFKEGSAVDAGTLEIDNNYKFVVLENGSAEVDELTIGSELSTAAGVKAIVLENPIEVVANSTWRVYIRYTDSGATTPGTTEVQFSALDSLNSGEYTVTATSAVGAGVKLYVDAGDFFAAGRFVYARKQGLIINPTSRNYTGTIGFKIEQDVVTVNDTTALYDNSGDNPNVAAPGADRWRIRLTLVDKDDPTLTSDDSFIFLCRIINSKIVEQVDELDSYNTINDMIARRTYEESGNYLAEPFQLTFEDDDSTDSDIFAIVSPGLAYVRGYRVENEYPLKLKVPRPQAYTGNAQDFIPVDYGSYVLFEFSKFIDFGDADGAIKVNLCSDASGTVTIGTAFVKSIAYHSPGVFRAYLDRIELTGSNSFTNVSSASTYNNNTSFFRLKNAGQLVDANKSTSLFPLSKTRPQNLTNYRYQYQRGYTLVVVGGTATSSQALATGDDTYVNETSWAVFSQASGDALVSGVDVTITDNGATFTLTGLSDGTYYVVADILRGASVNPVERKTKTLTVHTETVTLSSDGEAQLSKYDLYDLTTVTSGGNDITENFIIDNGSRDTHYSFGRIIDNTNKTFASVTVEVTYNFFEHGNDELANPSFKGRFFDFLSYVNIDYTQIPEHRMSDGTVVNLRDFVDFRGKKETNYISSIPPVEAQPIQLESSFYFSRADKLIATEDGEFQILMGQQDEQPLFKKTPENALELYKIVMNPNTLSPDDINTTFVEHKRYTMADIAKLERKLDSLEELYSLTYAELEAKLNPLLDEATGIPKNETGILIDDATDQTQSDTLYNDYCAALDPENKVIRPCFSGDNLRLIYRADEGADVFSSKNVLVKGDNAYLNYVTDAWISQPLGTRDIAINANSKSSNVGDMTLSPSSDEWKSEQIGTRVVPGGARLDPREALLYNSWQWNWGGRAIEDLEIEPVISRPYGGRRQLIQQKRRNVSRGGRRRLTASGGHVNRVISSETVRRISKRGRVLDAAIIPWIRSREIFFKVSGLKPNTKFTPFFDGVNVSDWCKGGKTFTRYANRTDDVGNQGQKFLTGHPEGSAEILSDSKGFVEGSFYIPNIRQTFTTSGIGIPNIVANLPFRFKAGKKEFKLLDITVNDINQAGSYASAIYNAAGMIDTRQDHMTTTRTPAKQKLRGQDRIKRSFNAAEIKKYLDDVGPSSVNMIEPHISGIWGGSFSPVVIPSNVPELSTVLSDYIAVDQNSQAGTSILPDQDISYPFAQSFTVDNQYGVVVTSVDLYFSSKPGNEEDAPVTVEILDMKNGKPGNTVVPGTTVSLEKGSVNTSVDVSVATNFLFEEPAYLDPGTEYAVVVKTASPSYKVWCSKAGEYKVGSTGVTVSTQSANGKLFLPQTGRAGSSKELDLAMVINRAVFDTNASLVLRNAVVPAKLLNKDPIVLKNGQSVAHVKHDCHGLHAGELVTISGVSNTGLSGSGVADTDLNGTHTVVKADTGGFTFSVPTITGNLTVGGTEVLSSRNVHFTTCNPQIETVVPNKCSIDISARYTTGQSMSGNSTTTTDSTKFTKQQTYTRIVPDQNQDFNEPKVIAQRAEEEYDGSGNLRPYNGQSINSNGGFSMDVKVDLKSSSDFVSPIVDLQRASMTLVQNCIDDFDAANGDYIDNAEETLASGTSSPSKHVTTPIKTPEPSESLEVKIDANVPKVANLDFYYRAVMTGQNILDKDWIKVDPVTPIVKDDDTQTFRNIKIQANDLPKFTESQVKVVMKSSSQAFVPQVGKIQHRTFLV